MSKIKEFAYQKSNTLPQRANGYLFSGLHCGLKSNGKKDLALIYSEEPAKAVACFTKNQVQAAPILQGRQALKSGPIQAILINSGNANAVTGKSGLQDSMKIAATVHKAFKFKKSQVLVSSTGKIGMRLPTAKIIQAIPKAMTQLAEDHLVSAAEAIMTTDRFIKVHQFKAKLGAKEFHITGIAKGAGMIEPNMATMLAYILTDIDAPQAYLSRVFKKAVDKSFNAITVDGDCSTNDTALLMANGLSGIKLSTQDLKSCAKFERGLEEVCQALAFRMVQDGEGATKVVEIQVEGARTQRAAQKVAYSIARSQLVKTSFFGEDPNWGRVLAAVGYSDEKVIPSQINIFYGDTCLLRKGEPTAYKNEQKAHQIMKDFYFKVRVQLEQGKASASVLTSDLTYDYVKINAEYRT